MDATPQGAPKAQWRQYDPETDARTKHRRRTDANVENLDLRRAKEALRGSRPRRSSQESLPLPLAPEIGSDWSRDIDEERTQMDEERGWRDFRGRREHEKFYTSRSGSFGSVRTTVLDSEEEEEKGYVVAIAKHPNLPYLRQSIEHSGKIYIENHKEFLVENATPIEIREIRRNARISKQKGSWDSSSSEDEFDPLTLNLELETTPIGPREYSPFPKTWWYNVNLHSTGDAQSPLGNIIFQNIMGQGSTYRANTTIYKPQSDSHKFTKTVTKAIISSRRSMASATIDDTIKLVTARPDGKVKPEEVQFRWIHIKNKVLNLEEFKQQVLRLEQLQEHDCAILLDLFDRVEKNIEQKYVNGRYMEEGAIRCDGKTSTESRAATFISVPTLKLQPLESITGPILRAHQKVAESPDHPIPALMQTTINLTSMAQEDKRQSTFSSRIIPKDQAVHVAQTWVLVINDNLLVTYSSFSLEEIAGPNIGFEEAGPDESVTILVRLPTNEVCYLDAEKCKSWFEFQTELKKAVRLPNGQAFKEKEWLIKSKDDTVLDSDNWAAHIGNNVLKIFRLNLEQRPTAPPYLRYSSDYDASGSGTEMVLRKRPVYDLPPRMPRYRTSWNDLSTDPYQQPSDENMLVSRRHSKDPKGRRGSTFSSDFYAGSRYRPSGDDIAYSRHDSSASSHRAGPFYMPAAHRRADEHDKHLNQARRSSGTVDWKQVYELELAEQREMEQKMKRGSEIRTSEDEKEERELIRRKMEARARRRARLEAEKQQDLEFQKRRTEHSSINGSETSATGIENKPDTESHKVNRHDSDSNEYQVQDRPSNSVKPGETEATEDSGYKINFNIPRWRDEDDIFDIPRQYPLLLEASPPPGEVEPKSNASGSENEKEPIRRIRKPSQHTGGDLAWGSEYTSESDTEKRRSAKLMVTFKKNLDSSNESLHRIRKSTPGPSASRPALNPPSLVVPGQKGRKYSSINLNGEPRQNPSSVPSSSKQKELQSTQKRDSIFYFLPSELPESSEKSAKEEKGSKEKGKAPVLPKVLPVFQWPTKASVEAGRIEKKQSNRNRATSRGSRNSFPPKKSNPEEEGESDESFAMLRNILDDLNQRFLKSESQRIQDVYSSCDASDFNEVEKNLKALEDVCLLSADSPQREKDLNVIRTKNNILDLTQKTLSFFVPHLPENWKESVLIARVWYCMKVILTTNNDDDHDMKLLFAMIYTKMESIERHSRTIVSGVAGDDMENPRYRIPSALVEAFRHLVESLLLALQFVDFLNQIRGNIEQTVKTQKRPVSLQVLERKFETCRLKLREGKLQLMSMIYTGRTKYDAYYEEVCTEAVVSFIMQNLVRVPLTPEGRVCSPADIYFEKLSKLDTEAKHRPQQKIIQQLNSLSKEVNAFDEVRSAQARVLWAADSLLHPRGSLNQHEPRPHHVLSCTAAKDKMGGRVGSFITEEQNNVDEHRRRSDALRNYILEALSLKEEDHGKAILVFTIVTTIFLPLNFTTSFFGMNTVDVRDMELDQRIFWATAIPITIAVVGFALIWAYFGEAIQDRIFGPYTSWGRIFKGHMNRRRKNYLVPRVIDGKGYVGDDEDDEFDYGRSGVKVVRQELHYANTQNGFATTSGHPERGVVPERAHLRGYGQDASHQLNRRPTSSLDPSFDTTRARWN